MLSKAVLQQREPGKRCAWSMLTAASEDRKLTERPITTDLPARGESAKSESQGVQNRPVRRGSLTGVRINGDHLKARAWERHASMSLELGARLSVVPAASVRPGSGEASASKSYVPPTGPTDRSALVNSRTPKQRRFTTEVALAPRLSVCRVKGGSYVISPQSIKVYLSKRTDGVVVPSGGA